MEETPAALDATGRRFDRVRDVNRLPPAKHRNWCIGLGLLVQLIGAAIPTAFVVVQAKHEAIAGLTYKSTLLVAARDAVHDRSGVLALAGGAILFALGSMLLARPYVRSVGMLFVAVPLAALVGVLLLGALVLVVVLIFVASDLPSGSGGGGGGDGKGSNKRKAAKPAPPR